jgi:hypothetical protein
VTIRAASLATSNSHSEDRAAQGGALFRGAQYIFSY